MSLLELGAGAIGAALKTGRAGTPVFVRIVEHMPFVQPQMGLGHVTASREQITEAFESAVVGALDQAAVWLESPPERLAALGSLERGMSVLVRFAGGQTALVSVSWAQPSEERLDVLVVGTHGIASWQSSRDDLRELPRSTDSAESSPVPWKEAIVSALAAGSAVVFQANGIVPCAQAMGTFLDYTSHHATVHRASQPPIVPVPAPIGVLLIAGDYSHQESYARAFAAERRCRIVAVSDSAGISDRRRRYNESLAKSLGVPWLPVLDSALARSDVHAVSLCAEPDRRGPIAVQCARARKHLYLDKPLCASTAEAAQIAAAVHASGVASQMFTMLHFPTGARIRRAVQEQAVGEVFALHADLYFAKGEAGTAKLGRRVESPQPPLFESAETKREFANVGVYPLALLRCIAPRRVRRLFAATGNYFFAEHQAADMEDFGVLMAEFEDGTVATISAGRTGWQSHPLGGVNRATLVGSAGIRAIDADRPRVELWTDAPRGSPRRREPLDPMAFWLSSVKSAQPKQSWVSTAPPADDIRAFIDALVHGRRSEADAYLAAEVQSLLAAAYQSAASGTMVAFG